MDRQQFCTRLNDRRNELEMSWLDLTIASKINSSTLRKILSGNINSFMKSGMAIAEALKCNIVVRKGDESVNITPDTLTEWLQISLKEAGLSINKFYEQVGLTRVAVTANLKGASKLRFDTFLTWAKVTGYMVEIVPRKSECESSN